MKATLPKNKHPEKLIKSDNLFPVIGIGASAGGLDAFKKLLKAIPVDSGMAFVLVQHLDPNHESLLPEILQKVTPIPVLEIADDIKVEPNHVYVIPSNKIMVATDGVLLLAPRPEKSKTERYLPIDLFFTSLAIVHQTHAIGVILSGTGTDGTLGLKAIKDYGGITFVQDEASAAYPDMPKSAVHAGVVDFILSPDKIPEKLVEVTQIISTPTSVEENLPLGDEEAFKQINAVLRIRKGTDFTYYKQTTIRRRILRRMAINKNTAPTEYLNYLRENKPEQDVLYQDLLIPVTAFFRDSTIFDNLCANVFPLLLKNKQVGEPIRIWIAGCSTGEEAYSIAICIKEFLGSQSLHTSEERVQLFATDLSERAITKARNGIYTKMEVVGIAPERLNEFFTKTNGSYQVNRQIRDMCVFATHNFLKDPPFGKMDLVSCRNVLIYMEPYLQKKALTTFHYALNPKGFLLLGKSETTGGVPDLFAATEKNDKLYSRKDAPSRFIHTVGPQTESNLIDNKDKPKTENMRSDFQKTADDIMLSKYAPSGVVINEAMDIVQFRGSTSRYLEQSSGKPSHNLLVLAKNGLAFELRNIIHKTKKGAVAVIKENVPLEINGNLVNITIEAIPLPNTIEPHYLILFHDRNSIGNKQESTENKKPTPKTKTDDKDLRIKQLELELTQTREDMRSITEDQEAANEELQSANEELLSGSEELQSLNEELETSKEELQSTNEELMVVNHEMIGLNEQIAAARNYAESIVANIREPLLVLDKNLRVKTANTSFYKTFGVNEKETEGTLIYNLGDKQWDIPELRTLLEKILPEKSIFTDFEVTHSFPVIGERIMLLNASEVINKSNSEKLILISIEDITKQRLFQLKEKKILSRYHKLLLQTPIAISIYRGSNYIAELVNDLALEILAKDKNLIGKPLFESMPEMESQLKPAFDEVMQSGIPFHANEFEATLIRNGKNEQAYFNTIFEPILEDDNTISGVIVVANEVTDQVLARRKIEESEERFQAAVAAVEGIIWTNNAKGEMEGEQLGWSLLTGQNYEAYQGYGWADAIHPDDAQNTLEAWHEAVRDRKNFVFEHRVKYKNENWGHFSVNAIPLLNADGSIREWVGVHTDITEKKQQQQMLAENEERLRIATQTSGVGIWEWNVITNKIRWDAQMFHIYGVTPTADGFVEYSTWSNAVVPEDLADQERILQDTVRNIGNSKRSFKIIRASDGMLSDIEAIETVRVNAEGNAEWVVGTNLDVTEQVLARNKVQASEHRYHEMIYSSPSMIAIFKGEDMIIEIANDAIIQSWGKGKDIIGKSLLSIMPEIIEQGFDKILSDVYKTGIPFHAYEAPVSLVHNGKIEVMHYTFIYQAQRNINGAIEGVAVIANEVTPQALANINLKESEERFRSLADNVPIHIFIVEPNEEASISYFNKNWLDYTGQSFDKALGNTWGGVVHPDDVTVIMEIYVPAFEKRKSYFIPAIRIKRHDGEYLWHSVQANPRYLPNGDFMGYIGIGFKIHEQKLAQDALKQSEKQFRLMAELMPQKIWTSDAEGNKDYFNKTLLDYAGKSFDELKGTGWEKIIHPDDWEKNKKQWLECLRTGKDYETENRLLRKDGHYLWHLTRAIALKNEDGKIKMWVGSKTEIQGQWEEKESLEKAVLKRTTELHKANKKLVHESSEKEKRAAELVIANTKLIYESSEKEKRADELVKINKELESFAYVSSHDLQEPLRKIQTFADRILEKETLSDSGKNYFRLMEDAAKRMQTLIEDLLSFSRLNTSERKFKITDLNDIVATVKADFKEIIDEKHATIEAKELCEANIIAFQFRQLMQNLIGNALKFSKPNVPPHILIKSRVIKGNKTKQQNLSPEKKYCHISVADNGIGFEEEFNEKVFEVFQKLHGKEEYAGTGIGLAIVKKIVENHQGEITVTSQLNEGTTFDIYLPAD